MKIQKWSWSNTFDSTQRESREERKNHINLLQPIFPISAFHVDNNYRKITENQSHRPWKLSYKTRERNVGRKKIFQRQSEASQQPKLTKLNDQVGCLRLIIIKQWDKLKMIKNWFCFSDLFLPHFYMSGPLTAPPSIADCEKVSAHHQEPQH